MRIVAVSICVSGVNAVARAAPAGPSPSGSRGTGHRRRESAWNSFDTTVTAAARTFGHGSSVHMKSTIGHLDRAEPVRGASPVAGFSTMDHLPNTELEWVSISSAMHSSARLLTRLVTAASSLPSVRTLSQSDALVSIASQDPAESLASTSGTGFRRTAYPAPTARKPWRQPMSTKAWASLSQGRWVRRLWHWRRKATAARARAMVCCTRSAAKLIKAF
mmetsp:Transcript_79688/g.213082  ORF Transcript_79688/g.213082 Transcript_79688/m.213082 type:complete len:219 (-) Transcript_79688:566-1222(-)